MCDLVPIQAR